MTYVVTDACINCKHMDCVEVCPVDCFYEGENTLVIKSTECIDCGVCEPECPADAIRADTFFDLETRKYWVDFNDRYAELWPNISIKRIEDVPADAEQWHGVPDKMKYLSENPGKGD